MGTVNFYWLVTFGVSPNFWRPFFELFSNGEISVRMEANNQLREFEDEPIVVFDPITVAVNSGASLSEPQGASIARNRKLPNKKGVNQQRFSAKTTKAIPIKCFVSHRPPLERLGLSVG